MLATINKDTQLCISLSGRPGNFGTRFHNFLYRELGLNFVYKAFTTNDIASAIGGIRALGIRGSAISMPFKEACIQYLDELDPSAKGIMSVNTIVNDLGTLKGYNTDYFAIFQLLKSREISPLLRFAVKGSGGMAKATVCALRDSGFRDGWIIARNQKTGFELAGQYGYEWKPEISDCDGVDLIINVTPIGMSGGAESDALAFSKSVIRRARVVFDVVAIPAETPLIRFAKDQGMKFITGAEVITLQALEQFVLYTGTRPDQMLVQRAAEHARANPSL